MGQIRDTKSSIFQELDFFFPKRNETFALVHKLDKLLGLITLYLFHNLNSKAVKFGGA